MKRINKVLQTVTAAFTAALVLYLALMCVYIFVTSDKDAQIFTADVAAKCLAPLVFAVPIYVVVVLFTVFTDRKMKKALSADPCMGASDKPIKIASQLRISLLCIAFVLVITGIFNGGARDVFVKAVNICTECIGLG